MNGPPAGTHERASDRGERVAAFVLVLIAVGLGAAARLLGLGNKPFWTAEIQEIVSARSPRFLAQILDSGTDVLGYMWSHVVWRLGLAPSEWICRAPAAVLGAATAAVVYGLGVRLDSRATGVAAAFLVAFSFYHVYHSQDMRSAALLTFFLSVSWLAMLEVFFYGRRAWVPVFAIAAGLTALCHAIAALFLVWQAAFFLALALSNRDRLTRYLLPALAALPLAAIQFYVVADYAFALQVTPVTVTHAMETEDLFLLRLFLAHLAGGPALVHWVQAGLAGLGLALLWARDETGCGIRSSRHPGRQRCRAAALLVWFLGPSATLYLVCTLGGMGRFEIYHLLPCAVPFALAAATGLAALARRAAGSGWKHVAAAGLAAAVLQGGSNAPTYIRYQEMPIRLFQGEDFRSLAAWLAKRPPVAGDAIFTNYSEHMIPLNFYAGGLLGDGLVVVPWKPPNPNWQYHMLLRARFQATDSDIVRLQPDDIVTAGEVAPAADAGRGRVLCIVPWVPESIEKRGYAGYWRWLTGEAESPLVPAVDAAALPAGFQLHRFAGVDVLERPAGEYSVRQMATELAGVLAASAPPLLRDMAPEVYGR